MFQRKWAAITTALLLAACATSSPDAMPDWKNGAKRAWVMEVYTLESPRAGLPECLAALPAAELQTRHFAKVQYHHVRQMFVEVGEFPDTLKPAVGDEVELWPKDCSQGEISRISRILSSAPK